MDIFFLVFYNSYFTNHSTLVFTSESTRRQTAKQQHRYFHCRAKFSQTAASIVDKVETFQEEKNKELREGRMTDKGVERHQKIAP